MRQEASLRNSFSVTFDCSKNANTVALYAQAHSHMFGFPSVCWMLIVQPNLLLIRSCSNEGKFYSIQIFLAPNRSWFEYFMNKDTFYHIPYGKVEKSSSWSLLFCLLCEHFLIRSPLNQSMLTRVFFSALHERFV